MKKVLTLILSGALLIGLLAGCTSNETTTDPNSNADDQNTASNPITVISREDGSGTRGAFIELFGIEQEDANGETVDMTIASAEITNNTSVMMTSVAGNPSAIGYISLGSLDETQVKALNIDGVAATVENINNGTYPVSRPFNIATGATVSDVAQDFINFILSAEGQAVVVEEGYIAVDDAAAAFTSNNASGNIVVAGSSSVTPVMEKLKEAYVAINPNATIEVQQSDSTTGMNSVIEGVCDIGMASREVKDSELEAGVVPTTIATDGIAVIVNLENSISDLTSDQVRGIYTGEITDWSEVSPQ